MVKELQEHIWSVRFFSPSFMLNDIRACFYADGMTKKGKFLIKRKQRGLQMNNPAEA